MEDINDSVLEAVVFSSVDIDELRLFPAKQRLGGGRGPGIHPPE
jgi:hypothetical protein